MTTKETFFKEKLENFTNFIAEEIGENNEVFKDFTKYKTDINAFLQDLISLVKLSGNNVITKDNINKYLEMKKIDKNIDEKAIDKIHRYFCCFIDVMNC